MVGITSGACSGAGITSGIGVATGVGSGIGDDNETAAVFDILFLSRIS